MMSERTSTTTIATCRDKTATGLMLLAAVGAFFSCVTSISSVAAACPATLVVEIWRMYGFIVFIGLYVLAKAYTAWTRLPMSSHDQVVRICFRHRMGTSRVVELTPLASPIGTGLAEGNYSTLRRVYSFTQPGVFTTTQSPALWPNSAFPTGDSLEISPAHGLAS